ncbi:hypothetical protein QFZ37_000173 [Chryseobacterium ginsenosidimutans]|nr:hypothetical protein [Chryseobacterium ginsenosidimutans]
MDTLDVLYYIIIIMNFIVSIVYKILWKQLFWLYFGITILIEILFTTKAGFITARMYNYLDLFCIIYFGYIYSKEIKDSYVIKIVSLSFFILGGIFIFISKTNYSIITGYLYCIFLIFISLFWFYKKISNKNQEENILNLYFFWISSSLLFWAMFYIFRMFPMYFFDKKDPEFLKEISKVFTMINIITYSLFLRGLFCKQ